MKQKKLKRIKKSKHQKNSIKKINFEKNFPMIESKDPMTENAATLFQSSIDHKKRNEKAVSELHRLEKKGAPEKTRDLFRRSHRLKPIEPIEMDHFFMDSDYSIRLVNKTFFIE